MINRLRFMNNSWFLLFVVGALLFFASEQSLKFTGNTNLVPTVILLGAFVVPVAFVAYFYGRERIVDRGSHVASPFGTAATSFLLGGILGVLLAGTIEYKMLLNFSFPGLFGVGLIEESAKLIVPLVIYLRGRFRSEADGLLFGVASGMGFAALETMGYGLSALMDSRGDIGALEEVLLIRGLFSPAGHAAWTGIVCAVLWRERERTGRNFNLSVLGVFAIVVVLHALWNIVGSVSQIVALAGYVIIGGASLALLIRRIRESSHIQPIPQKV